MLSVEDLEDKIRGRYLVQFRLLCSKYVFAHRSMKN